ncbi:hypothetical protein [Pseudophaeobacter leonis]|uniref:hypothetical protein n=1 Tax=Pseudophaeobacter leonis TaxID=1144477 RepID=UPI00111C5BA5|nr:hypothetical protein [Pseudophaeobacter leonis]
MDQSLASDNLLTRNTALDTIAATRLGLGVLAVVLAILAVWAPRIAALPWVQRRLREGSSFPRVMRIINVCSTLRRPAWPFLVASSLLSTSWLGTAFLISRHWTGLT